MSKHILGRERRAIKIRKKMQGLHINKRPRLTIHISNQHIYAQLLNEDGSRVLASASTVDKALRTQLKSQRVVNIAAATQVGKAIAERALAAGVTRIGFDRSGFKYHGRVKALAEAARANGLDF